jgi:ribonuclease R
MEYDEFRHIESDYCLAGLRSGRRFAMGDKVRIKVVAANLTKRQLDYEWVITSSLKESDGGTSAINKPASKSKYIPDKKKRGKK